MAKRELPNYTKKEELFNAISHIVGGGFGIIALTLGIIFGIRADLTGLEMFSVVLYGVSMILLYTMSSLYHFLPKNRAKRLFRIFDHCTIYLLIAGTYSPICIIALSENSLGIILLSIIWGSAIIGITFNAINMYWKSVKILSMFLYLAMGWSAVFAAVPLIETLDHMGLIWILVGGMFYTVGVIFYAKGKNKKYAHGVWHIFCLAGTMIHFMAILIYIIGV